jgi:hypothetical protein
MDENGRVARGKGSCPQEGAKLEREATGGPRCGGGAGTACRHFGGFCGANDSARAADTDDTSAGSLDTPPASCHQLPDGVPAGAASAQQDSAACHRAGGQSRIQSIALLSRYVQWHAARSLVSGRVHRQTGRGPERTRWFASVRACDGVPPPPAGSRPMVPPLASTPAPRPHDCTSGRHRSPDPNRPAAPQTRRDVSPGRRHRRRYIPVVEGW